MFRLRNTSKEILENLPAQFFEGRIKPKLLAAGATHGDENNHRKDNQGDDQSLEGTADLL